MSQPFSGIPNPGSPRPFKRRLQPEAFQQTLRKVLSAGRQSLTEARYYGRTLWQRGKRHPRALGLAGAAVGMTLIGAYALNASGPGRSHCPPISKLAASKKEPKGGKTQPFLLLMDQVPHPAAGSKLEILYDVCGLPSGTAYRGRVRLSQQVTKAKAKGKGKKKPVQPKPLVMAFDDEVDGVATRRRQELELGSTKPGVYTLELSVVDSRGRERKKLQKLVVKPQ